MTVLSPHQFDQAKHDIGGHMLGIPVVGPALQFAGDAAWHYLNKKVMAGWNGKITGDHNA